MDEHTAWTKKADVCTYISPHPPSPFPNPYPDPLHLKSLSPRAHPAPFASAPFTGATQQQQRRTPPIPSNPSHHSPSHIIPPLPTLPTAQHTPPKPAHVYTSAPLRSSPAPDQAKKKRIHLRKAGPKRIHVRKRKTPHHRHRQPTRFCRVGGKTGKTRAREPRQDKTRLGLGSCVCVMYNLLPPVRGKRKGRESNMRVRVLPHRRLPRDARGEHAIQEGVARRRPRHGRRETLLAAGGRQKRNRTKPIHHPYKPKTPRRSSRLTSSASAPGTSGRAAAHAARRARPCPCRRGWRTGRRRRRSAAWPCRRCPGPGRPGSPCARAAAS